MADLRREDGVLVETWPNGEECRIHEADVGLGVRLYAVEWVSYLPGKWVARHGARSIGTRAELAALATAFPVEPDRG